MHLHTYVFFLCYREPENKKQIYSKPKGLLNFKQTNKMSYFVTSTQFNSQTVNALAKKKLQATCQNFLVIRAKIML